MNTQKFTLFTDSACDIPPEILKKWNVRCISLNYRFEDSDRIHHRYEISMHEFYDILRCGAGVKASSPKTSTFVRAFEKELSAGKDILYIVSSSAAGTVSAHAEKAASLLKNKYPDRKIVIVDSRTVSSGCGLLIYHTVRQICKGADFSEAAQYAADKRRDICNFFTVEDMSRLKKSSLISGDLSVAGTLAGVKPVFRIDRSGGVSLSSTSRGRKASVAALADTYAEKASHPENGTVFISHADCRSDAEELAYILKKRFRISAEIFPIGPAVGSHSGPGTLSLSFVGNNMTF